MRLPSIHSKDSNRKGETMMSAEITGAQPNQTDKKTQVRGDELQSEPVSDPHELAPDRPPLAVDATGEKPKRPRGFAAMDRKLVSEIARKGGKAAHSAGTAHEFTTEEARVAGQKGGRATHAKRRKIDEEGKEGQG
jgi:general stress protein YciG